MAAVAFSIGVLVWWWYSFGACTDISISDGTSYLRDNNFVQIAIYVQFVSSLWAIQLLYKDTVWSGIGIRRARKVSYEILHMRRWQPTRSNRKGYQHRPKYHFSPLHRFHYKFCRVAFELFVRERRLRIACASALIAVYVCVHHPQ